MGRCSVVYHRGYPERLEWNEGVFELESDGAEVETDGPEGRDAGTERDAS